MGNSQVKLERKFSQRNDSIRRGKYGKPIKKKLKLTNSKRKAFNWDKRLIEINLMNNPDVTHVVIVNFEDKQLRAVLPAHFQPEEQGVNDIIDALVGDTRGVEERGVHLGDPTPHVLPGKIDDGLAIYCSDGHGGGCVIRKTLNCVLIVFYTGNPDGVVRLATGVARFMERHGR